MNAADARERMLAGPAPHIEQPEAFVQTLAAIESTSMTAEGAGS